MAAFCAVFAVVSLYYLIGLVCHKCVRVGMVRIYIYIWVFPKIGIPQNGWFIVENPIEMDDLGYPYSWKHPCIHILYVRLYETVYVWYGTSIFFQESNLYGLHGLDGWYMFLYICIYRN